MNFLLFFGALLALFLLARFINTTLFRLLYRQTGSVGMSAYVVAVIYFPGVVIHEFSHVFAALLLGVRVGKMEFMPVFANEQLKLGSVQIEKTDPLRKTLIGIAPVFGGLSAILVVLWAVTSQSQSLLWTLISAIFVYQVGSTMFSSKKDLEGTGVIFVVIFLIVGLLWFLNFPLLGLLDTGAGRFVGDLFGRAAYFLGIAVLLNTIIAVILGLIIYLRRK